VLYGKEKIQSGTDSINAAGGRPEKLLEFIKSEPGYTEEKLLKMTKLFIVENKKLGLYNPDGDIQASWFFI